jgi:hypothetical protein
MAKWGQDGVPSRELFLEVLDMDGENSLSSGAGVNYLQCLGITNAVIGERSTAEILILKAREKIRRSNSREFSAWAYLTVGVDEFNRHLNDIERMNKGEHCLPLFIEGSSGLLEFSHNLH